MVDTLGLVLRVRVHPAAVTDRVGGQWRLEQGEALAQAFPRLQHLWVDSAYQGSFPAWVEQMLGGTVQVVRRPRRWVVERTFGWLGRWRRTRKDYEYLPATSACVVELVMICLMLRRLVESPP